MCSLGKSLLAFALLHSILQGQICLLLQVFLDFLLLHSSPSLLPNSDLKKVGKTSRSFRYDLNQIPHDYTVEVRNRFKELDLIDRVPDELWMEVHDIVQETGIKTTPMEKKCKKAKWLSEEALQIAVKRREVKSKGEKERYSHLNAEFQRIARRDKKAFLSDQCKKIVENNTMGKTRDLFKKIEIPREHFTHDGFNKGQKCYGPKRSRRY